jgi:hypothetical protein
MAINMGITVAAITTETFFPKEDDTVRQRLNNKLQTSDFSYGPHARTLMKRFSLAVILKRAVLVLRAGRRPRRSWFRYTVKMLSSRYRQRELPRIARCPRRRRGTTPPLYQREFGQSVRAGFSVAVLAPASASRATSPVGVMNEEEPQSRQTRSFGNTRTPGLFAFLRPGKWMFTSAGNTLWLLEAQNVHDMANPPKLDNCKCRVSSANSIRLVALRFDVAAKHSRSFNFPENERLLKTANG